MGAENSVAYLLYRNGGERCFRRRLPDDTIAADRGDKGVPGPDGHRKVEGRNDADQAERMPLLIHAMQRAFTLNRQAVELPGEADREVGDVDHLLDFTLAFRKDLAHLECDERAEVVKVFPQFIADGADNEAALGGGEHSPASEDFLRIRDHLLVFSERNGLHHAEQRFIARAVGRQLGSGTGKPLLSASALRNATDAEPLKNDSRSRLVCRSGVYQGCASHWKPSGPVAKSRFAARATRFIV